MNKLNLTGKQIRAIGYPEGPVVSIAMQVMNTHYKFTLVADALQILKNILASPIDFVTHDTLQKIAKMLITKEEKNSIAIPLNEKGIEYNIFGAKHIEEGAIKQMEIASRLPVSVAGALMPGSLPCNYLCHFLKDKFLKTAEPRAFNS